jgi:integrase
MGSVRECREHSGTGGLSPRSVRYINHDPAEALQDAAQWSVVTRNPADIADPPKTQRAESTVRTGRGPQLKQFLDSVSEYQLVAAWTLAATTGMRRGEVLGLRWSDVELHPNGESRVVATGFSLIETFEFDATGILYLMAGSDVLKVTGLD